MAQSSRHGMPGSTLFSSYLTAIRSFVQCLDTSLLHTPGNRRGRGGVEQRLAAPHHDAVAEDRARLPRHRGARTRPPAVRARIPRGTRGPRRRVPSEEEIRAHRAKDVHVSLPGPGYAEIRAPRSRLRMARPHGRICDVTIFARSRSAGLRSRGSTQEAPQVQARRPGAVLERHAHTG